MWSGACEKINTNLHGPNLHGNCAVQRPLISSLWVIIIFPRKNVFDWRGGGLRVSIYRCRGQTTTNHLLCTLQDTHLTAHTLRIPNGDVSRNFLRTQRPPDIQYFWVWSISTNESLATKFMCSIFNIHIISIIIPQKRRKIEGNKKKTGSVPQFPTHHQK